MIEIPLTQGRVTLIDDEDFELVSKYKWYVSAGGKIKKHWYAATMINPLSGRPVPLRMHRLIMEPPPSIEIDHIDGDGLNNQKYNLRFATRSQNSRNADRSVNNSSGYKGVGWHKRAQKWRAYIMRDGKNIHLGLYDSPLEAAKAYNEASIVLHGNFARPNIIGDIKS